MFLCPSPQFTGIQLLNNNIMGNIGHELWFKIPISKSRQKTGFLNVLILVYFKKTALNFIYLLKHRSCQTEPGFQPTQKPLSKFWYIFCLYISDLCNIQKVVLLSLKLLKSCHHNKSKRNYWTMHITESLKSEQ